MRTIFNDKELRQTYRPAIISGVILAILVGALLFMVFFDGNLDLEDVPDNNGHDVSEIIVDIDKKKCPTDIAKKLIKQASKVEMKTEEKAIKEENNFPDDDGENYYTYKHIWNVSFTNMTDDLYLKVTNDKNEKVTIINKDNLMNGKWAFDTDESIEVITYTIAIMTNLDNCKDQTIRKLQMKALIFNGWSGLESCQLYKDFKYCQRYTDEDMLTFGEFQSELRKYLNKHPELKGQNSYGLTVPTSSETTTKKVEETTEKDNSEKNKVLITILVFGAIAIVTGVVTVILLKKKRSK